MENIFSYKKKQYNIFSYVFEIIHLSITKMDIIYLVTKMEIIYSVKTCSGVSSYKMQII